MELEGRRVLVLGLGDSGLSMTRWLAHRGAVLRLADSRPAPPRAAEIAREFPHLPCHLGPFTPALFADVDLIAISPGVPLSTPALAEAIGRGLPVVGDVELFARYLPRAGTRIVAITGSNGKSTVTSLVGAIGQAAGWDTVVAGNIGLPVLSVLLDIETGHRPLPALFALELSSFQLETTASLSADASVVLNLSQDHLDRYADMAAYAAAKARIYEGARFQLVNRDDPWVRAMVRPGKGAAPVSFGLDAPPRPEDWGVRVYASASQEGSEWLAHGEERLLPVGEILLAGRFNLANALAAAALADAVGLPREAIVAALTSFRGLPHRVSLVAEIAGVRFYDDSKGTNVGATLAALSGFEVPVVLIAGGDGKGQDFAPLAPACERFARAVVLLGRDAPRIRAALTPAHVPVIDAQDMDDAVRKAASLAHPGDVVLLSPACASFDMFRDYVHRAKAFVAAVSRLEREMAR